MTAFVVNDERVNRFVTEMNGMTSTGVHSSIGVERDGEIIGGVIYTDPTSESIFLHVASNGKNWMSRAFLKLVFGFAFEGLKVNQIVGLVPETNEKARRLDEHLGFRLHSIIPGIYRDGGLCVYLMDKPGCRWLSIPRFKSANPTNGGRIYTKEPSEEHACLARTSQSSDFFDGRPSQFRLPITFSRIVDFSPFGLHIASASPIPASVGFLNVFPKSLAEGFVEAFRKCRVLWNFVVGHNQDRHRFTVVPQGQGGSY